MVLSLAVLSQPAGIPQRFVGTAKVAHELLTRAFPNISIDAAPAGDRLALSSWGHGCAFDVRGQLPAVELLGSCRVVRDGFELDATLRQAVISATADGAVALHLSGTVEVHRQSTYTALGSSVSVRLPLGTAEVTYDGVAVASGPTAAPPPIAAAGSALRVAKARAVLRAANTRQPLPSGCSFRRD